MDQKTENGRKPAEEPFYVDEFRPEDAEGIVSLFFAVYGEGYPIRLFYDPDAIRAANRDGSYLSIVARTDSGNVVGVNHLYHSAPCHKVYETGVGLVLKDYRNSGANKKTLTYLYEEYVPRHPNVEELFGEAVCNHIFMQKTVDGLGFKETGIEVALMPAEAYTQEKSAAGRVAVLDIFRSYIPHPHRIYLPLIYAPVLRKIYDRLQYVRDIAVADKIFPPDRTTFAEQTVFDFAHVTRIAVHQSGSDLAEHLAHLEDQARLRKVVVFQVWLNLTEPWSGYAVEVLRDRGYFFGGALPRWFDGDGLLMQKMECPPDFDKIQLYSDFSKELLDYIQKDWECISG